MTTVSGVPPVDYEYVDNDEQLKACCQRWQHCEALALDTEFMRVTTFYPDAALFQVSDGKEITLIDPLQIEDWSALRELLINPAIVKLLHSCSEDLLVFIQAIGVIPSPLFDTQVAASMLEHGLSISYQNLVLDIAGIDLPKGETRSDWLQRPLTESQQDYAALDVVYLHQIWRQQTRQLAALDRSEWMQEECQRLGDTYRDEQLQDFSRYYQNFKAAWQLEPRQLAALQKLAQWREQRARIRNRPRSWIVKDSALLGIAQAMINTKAGLLQIKDVSENFVRYEGEKVLALIEEAKAMPLADCPSALPKPLTSAQKSRLKKAKLLVEKKAVELDISPEFLGRKKTLQALLYALMKCRETEQDLQLPAELQGWRGPLMLDELIGVLQP